MKAQLVALAFPFVFALPALADDRVDVFTNSTLGRPTLKTIELDAGAVVAVESVDLQSITSFTLPPVYCLEHVGDEVWLGTAFGFLRYGGSPLAFVGQHLTGDRILAITDAPFGGILVGVREVIEVDANGVEFRRVDTAPSTFRDIDPFQGGYLGTANDSVRILDLDYVDQGEFAPTAFAIALQNNIGYFPDRITILNDGRVVVAGITSVGIIEPSGIVQAIANPGSFERDVFETGAGLLLVPTSLGLLLMDDVSLEVYPSTGSLTSFNAARYGSRYSTSQRGASGRSCTATANSTGAEGRLHILASPSVADLTLSSIATDLPPFTFGLPVFGRASTNVPFGDGRLCVSPFAPGLARGPVAAVSATGSLRTDFDFVTPGLGGSFLPGTTWHYQVLFRDSGPAGFDGTDAVFVTFEP